MSRPGQMVVFFDGDGGTILQGSGSVNQETDIRGSADMDCHAMRRSDWPEPRKGIWLWAGTIGMTPNHDDPVFEGEWRELSDQELFALAAGGEVA